MTLDLDELERYAKAIDAANMITSPHGVVAPSPMMEINPRAVLTLIERVRSAENVGHEWMALQKAAGFPQDGMTRSVKDVSDAVVLMAERVRELEAAVPRCGCGATSSVRGDPECDGCGKDCYYCTCGATKETNA